MQAPFPLEPVHVPTITRIRWVAPEWEDQVCLSNQEIREGTSVVVDELSIVLPKGGVDQPTPQQYPRAVHPNTVWCLTRQPQRQQLVRAIAYGHDVVLSHYIHTLTQA